MITESPLAFQIATQVKLLLYSFLGGAVLGAFFDLLRISRVFLRSPPYKSAVRFISDAVLFTVTLIEDILFFVVSAVCIILFCFKTNFGEWRGCMLVFAVLGFLIYINTVGRLTSLISRGLAAFMWFILHYISVSIIIPFARLILRLLSAIYRVTLKPPALAVYRFYAKIKAKHIPSRFVNKLEGVVKKRGKRNESSADVNTRQNSDLRRVPVSDNYACRRKDRIYPKERGAGKASPQNRQYAGEHR